MTKSRTSQRSPNSAPSANSDDSTGQLTPEGLKHAWDWFDFHAKQRMQTINFYVLVVAALLAGVGSALTNEQFMFSGLLGTLIVLASFLFYAMDQRARELVRFGEDALRCQESLLGEREGVPAYNFIERANEKPKHGFSY